MKDIPIVDFESAAFDPEKVQVRKLDGREYISQLFEFKVHIVCSEPGGIDPAALMSNPGALIVRRRSSNDGEWHEQRRINGIVRHVADRLVVGARHTEYTLTFVPRAWQSTLTTITDIFQDMNVEDVITKKLKENCGLQPGKDFEFRLMATYPAEEFILQYQETDLHFIQRLAEHEGIFYFFEHHDGIDVMVFADDNSHFTPTEPASVPLMMRGDETNIYDLDIEHQLVTTTFRTRDYNYRNPGMDLQGEVGLPHQGSGVSDEYGSHFKTPDDAKRLAQVRSEETGWQHKVYVGMAEEPGLRTGAVVKVEGHPRGDLELALVEIHHWAVQPAFGMGGKDEETYTNKFRAILKATPYRPPRLTPKPVVPGVLTGLVESEQETEQGAIDEHGRYRVAFMCDAITGRDKGKASRPLRMAQPSAGADRGFHMPLKVGTEVLVTCVNGDPDRPIIMGAVPNPRTASPINATNAEKSGMRTNKSEWFFDDAQPRFKLAVDGETNVFQVGAPNADEQGIAVATTDNYTSMANNVTSHVTSLNSSFNSVLAAFAGRDIVQMAGAPNPFTMWQKVQAGVSAVTEFAKNVASVPQTVQKFSEGQASRVVKVAEKAHKDKQKEVVKALGKTYAKDKIQVDNPDGTKRDETEDEFNARVCKKLASKKQKASLQTTAKKVEKAKGAEAENKKAFANSPAGKGSVGVANAINNAVGAAGSLLSTMSKVYANAAEALNIAAVKGMHNVAKVGAGISTQREPADLGDVGTPYNIQGATNTAVLYGVKNAFAFSPKHATLMGGIDVNIVGGTGAHLKSEKCSEVASLNAVKLSSQNDVDAWAGSEMKLVAHPGGRSKAMPGGHTMMLWSKLGIHMESDTKDIEGKAKESIKLEASTKDLCAFGKNRAYIGADGFGMVAKGDNVMLGKLNSASDLMGASVDAETGLCYKKDSFEAKAKKSRVRLDAKKANLKSGGSTLNVKKSGDVVVTAKGQFKAKGKKVMLG